MRLPVAGLEVRVQLPTGAEDLLLLEAAGAELPVALALLDRVVARADGEPLDAAALAVTDVDVLALRVRQRAIGDRVQAELRCPACGARVDLAFSIDEYVAHHAPERADAEALGDGWWRVAAAEFRLPTVRDQLAAAGDADALFARCVRGAVGEGAREAIEAAMEAMAPSLASELEGACPACAAPVAAEFDPVAYAVRELRDQAAFVYEEVAAIARHMHWSEAEILALPAARRVRYAELARAQVGA